MKIYRVGGAVRDALLGLPAGDTDWVVVGASPEAMVARGFTPVGRDFPVFLHPGTHEEYALARTERKTARGYHGFVFNCAPEVTLEEDLARRDLTINAIAQAEDGSLIDPFGGQADLAARILRHVGPAFAEDPVRILRLARFAARFPDFTIAPETMALMRAMVAAGEVDALVPERSWQEIARGLATAAPARMFASLRACGALARILPELDALPETEFRLALAALDRTAAAGAPAEVRFAALCARLASQAEAAAAAIETLASRLRVPGRYRTLAALVAREYANIVTAPGSTADQLARLVGRLDLVRRPERLEPLLAATCAVWAVRRDATTDPGQPPMLAGPAAQGRVATHSSCEDFPAADWLRRISVALARIDAGAVAAEADSPGQIPARIHAARVAAIRAVEDQRPR